MLRCEWRKCQRCITKEWTLWIWSVKSADFSAIFDFESHRMTSQITTINKIWIAFNCSNLRILRLRIISTAIILICGGFYLASAMSSQLLLQVAWFIYQTFARAHAHTDVYQQLNMFCTAKRNVCQLRFLVRAIFMWINYIELHHLHFNYAITIMHSYIFANRFPFFPSFFSLSLSSSLSFLFTSLHSISLSYYFINGAHLLHLFLILCDSMIKLYASTQF